MKRLLFVTFAVLTLSGCAKVMDWNARHMQGYQQQAQQAQYTALRTLCLSSPACLQGFVQGTLLRPYTVSVTPLGSPAQTLYVYPQPYGTLKVCNLYARCAYVTQP